MRFNNLKQDKGVAGLQIILSIVTMIFVIGLLVMIFVLMSGELQTASYDTTTTERYNVLAGQINDTAQSFLHANDVGLRDITCAVSNFTNGTNSLHIGSGNYTVSACTVVVTTSVATDINNTDWNVTYDYTYEANNTATDIMQDTVNGLSDVPDWFPIVIVIGFMVVLILLTVLIITAIKGSGLMMTGGSEGVSGTA